MDTKSFFFRGAGRLGIAAAGIALSALLFKCYSDDDEVSLEENISPENTPISKDITQSKIEK